MKRIFGWFTRVNAFRIGLVIGLFFAGTHVYNLARRGDIPLLTKMESAMTDLRLKQSIWLGASEQSGRVVIAAVDEPAIGKFGRFPWDRRVMAGLIDKLNEEGAAAVGFDMSFSDEDLGGQFAGAKRYRKRFEDISLASPRNRASIERFDDAESEISGAASALGFLSRKVEPDAEPIYATAKGRLEDGKQKVTAVKTLLASLLKQHEEYAAELDHDLTGNDPDHELGAAVGRAAGKVVLGWVALTQPEMKDFKPEDAEDAVKAIERSKIVIPEFSRGEGLPSTPFPISWIKEYSGLRPPLAPIARDAKWFGYFNTLPDYDGVIRHSPLVLRIRGRYLPSLELAVAAVALGVDPRDIIPITSNDTGDGDFDHIELGKKRSIPTDARGLLEIHYFGTKGTFNRYSIADIMTGALPKGTLKDKVVIVAATAQGTFDQRVTPLDKDTAGVETHVNAIETILSGKYLKRGILVDTLEVFFLLFTALAFAFIFARVKVQLALPVVVISAAAVWVVASVLFIGGYSVFAALPLVELGAMFVLVTVYRYATEERDKRQLRKAFQLYLNPEVMEEMLEQPASLQLGGKELELSVMFSDIRGFTTIAEKLSPQALVHLLNAYLSPMTDIVFRRRGTLDKYIGDAVMAFFGAPVQTPLHAANACDAALEMMEVLARLREQWRIEDPNIPEVDIGIGINSGPMVVGNMGSQQRFNYTVMGDNVNLASRLEGLNKEYGTHILVTEPTLHAARKGLQEPAAYLVRELDAVRVKGKKDPVRLFELRRRGPALTEEVPLLEGYAEGLRLYRAQKFSEARLQFESLLERFPHDGPSRLFLRRCDDMTQSPPGEDWDGVFKMEHK